MYHAMKRPTCLIIVCYGLLFIALLVSCGSPEKPDSPQQTYISLFNSLYHSNSAHDTAAFLQAAEDNPCLLNSACAYTITKYALHYNKEKDSLAVKIEGMLELLSEHTDISPDHRRLIHDVTTEWCREQFDEFKAANERCKFGTRMQDSTWQDSLELAIETYDSLGCLWESSKACYNYGYCLISTNSQLDYALALFRKAENSALQSWNIDKFTESLLPQAFLIGREDKGMVEAIRLYNHASELSDSCNLSGLAAYEYLHFGNLYYKLKYYRLAISKCRKAARLAREIGTNDNLIQAQSLMAKCYQDIGQLQVADSLYELAYQLSLDLNAFEDISWMDIYKAEREITSGSTTGIESILLDAMSTLKGNDKKGVATAAYQLGRLKRREHSGDEAVRYFHSALGAYTDIKDSIYPLKEIGLTYLDMQNLDSSSKYLQLTESSVERVLADVPCASLRREYVKDKYEVVAGLVKLNVAIGNHGAALEMAERYHARSLYDALRERQFAGSQDSIYREQKSQLRSKLNDLLRHVRQCPDNSGNQVDLLDRFLAVNDSITDLYMTESAIRPTDLHLPITGSKYFSSSQESDQKCLYYFCHDSDIIVWYISDNELKSSTIADSKDFVKDSIQTALRLISCPPRTRESTDSLTALLEYLKCLIPEVIRKSIDETNTLVIYPSGILSCFPFEALRLNDRYLAETTAVKYYPSLSLKRYLTENTARTSKIESIAFLGGEDYRNSSDMCRNSLNGILGEYQKLQNLPGVLEEAEVLKSIFDDCRVFTDIVDYDSVIRCFDKLSSDVLHISSHGIVSDVYPEMSAIVFPFDSGSTNDQALLTDEIASLRLNIPLIVLSACNSGAGKYVDGDGKRGITRSFILAGARSLVVTQWTIEDKASVFFFKSFYTTLRSGESTAEALKVSKIRMIESEVYSHPYFWAPFAAISNWN